MPAGRPRKPSEIKALHAKDTGRDAGGRKLPGTEIARISDRGAVGTNISKHAIWGPEDLALINNPPAHLRVDGQRHWNRVFEYGWWLHPQEDVFWVEMLASASDDIAVFRQQIMVDGLMTKNYAGADTANPLLREIRTAQGTIMKCLSILGFSPSDRARLDLKNVQLQSGIADLQAKTHAAAVAPPPEDEEWDYASDEPSEPEDTVDGEVVE